MPIVQVQMLQGRDAELIEDFGTSLTDFVEQKLGVPRDTIRVVIAEVPAEHWFKDGRSIARIRREKNGG
jgi:4-oxalocrotonate tautomerase